MAYARTFGPVFALIAEQPRSLGVYVRPRPGRIETIMTIDLPRPRGLAARKDPRFAAAVDAITEIFLERGVLQRRVA